MNKFVNYGLLSELLQTPILGSVDVFPLKDFCFPEEDVPNYVKIS